MRSFALFPAFLRASLVPGLGGVNPKIDDMVLAIPLLAVLTADRPLADFVARERDHRPRVYRFNCDYMTLTVKGKVLTHRVIDAKFHSDDPKGRLRWTDIVFQGKPQAFMEGFSYAWTDVANTGKPEFFATIPGINVECRNLVWDTHMFENYAHEHLAKLRLNQPVTIRQNADSELAGSGSFHDENIDLTWIGDSKWKGVPCAVIRYRAFFNRFTYQMGPMPADGTSDYWGEINLAKRTNRIEYADIYESVSVLMGKTTTPIRVFRIGTFEHV